MPWCRLDRKCAVGPVSLIPFSHDNLPANFEPRAVRAVETILSDFIAIDGRPVLVSLDERVYDYVQMACLSSLEGPEYLGRAEPYCNSECFALYARQYRDGAAVAPPILRRDGTPKGLAGTALRGHIPIQTVAVPSLSLNKPLYRALAELRRRLLEERRLDEWPVWAESIYSFNLATKKLHGVKLLCEFGLRNQGL